MEKIYGWLQSFGLKIYFVHILVREVEKEQRNSLKNNEWKRKLSVGQVPAMKQGIFVLMDFSFGKEFNRDYFISKHGGKNRSVHLSYFDEIDFYFLKWFQDVLRLLSDFLMFIRYF